MEMLEKNRDLDILKRMAWSKGLCWMTVLCIAGLLYCLYKSSVCCHLGINSHAQYRSLTKASPPLACTDESLKLQLT